ncbi:MAG: hypothetical protein EXR27_08810 [Betaproteobacteria bacterium]|nr:hypothetical protein [Betaproteobacteria bacterium]
MLSNQTRNLRSDFSVALNSERPATLSSPANPPASLATARLGDALLPGQLHAGEVLRVQLFTRYAVGKQPHLGAVAALDCRHQQQFEKGAGTHQDLPPERIGCGKQSFGVQTQGDLSFGAQVRDPGLPVVGIRREQGVRKNPAPQLDVLARSLDVY